MSLSVGLDDKMSFLVKPPAENNSKNLAGSRSDLNFADILNFRMNSVKEVDVNAKSDAQNMIASNFYNLNDTKLKDTGTAVIGLVSCRAAEETFKTVERENSPAQARQDAAVNEKPDDAEVEKDEEKSEEAEKEENERNSVEKYLQDAFMGQVGFKASKKQSDLKGTVLEGMELSARNIGNVDLQAFNSKIEAMLKKQFPGINVSKYKIEIVSFSAAKSASIKPGADIIAVSDKINARLSSASHLAESLSNNSLDGKPLKNGNSGKGGRRNDGSSDNQSFNMGQKLYGAELNKTQAPGQPAGVEKNGILDQVKNTLNDYKLNSKDGVYNLKMILNPESAGRVDLELILKNGELTAKFNVDSDATRESLMASSERLKEMLNEKGVKTVNIEFSSDRGNNLASGGQGHFNDGGTGPDSGFSGGEKGPGAISGHVRPESRTPDEVLNKGTASAYEISPFDGSVNLKV